MNVENNEVLNSTIEQKTSLVYTKVLVIIVFVLLLLLVSTLSYYLGTRQDKSVFQVVLIPTRPIVITHTPLPTQNTLSITLPVKNNNLPSSQNGADLQEIRYTLPSGWQAEIRDNSLFLSLKSGGYLSIQVYPYNGTSGRREYFCQVTHLCLDNTSYFNAIQIGNISGYVANALDNSGGSGAEYFGAKGDKFYVIGSFSPSYPTPNEFDNTYKSVISSLIF